MMIELLFGVVLGIVLSILWSMRPFLPSKVWKPEANTDDKYQIVAYKAAAKNLNIRMKLGPPVPCAAGTAACGGMTGIWIHRDDAKKLAYNQLTDEMWAEMSKITD